MKALDDAWISRLQKAAGVAPYPYFVLGPSPVELRMLFDVFEDSGYRSNPVLKPDKQGLLDSHIEDSVRHLQELQADISLREKNIIVRDLYIERIDELLASLEMITAADSGDIGKFRELNARVYGAPNPGIFHAAKAALDTDDNTIFAPDEAAYQHVWDAHNGIGGYFEQLFEGVDIPADGPIDQYIGDELLRALLRNLEATDYTIVDAPDLYWGVNHTDKQLIRPKWYSMTRPEFLGIVGHEIGSHLLELLRGSKSRLALLGFGLAGYEQYNEGRALIREQVAYPDWKSFAATDRWHEILCRHVSIGLAAGMNGKPWTFSEIYSYMLDKYARRLPYEEQAHRPTWRLLTRCLSGTDGQGGAYYKDIVYLEGNLRCWQLAKQDPDIIMLGDSGKYNHANLDQVERLHKLEVL